MNELKLARQVVNTQVKIQDEGKTSAFIQEKTPALTELVTK